MTDNISRDSYRKEERLWNAEYIKVMACNFLLFFAFYLLTPLLPIYLDAEFKADKDMIGYVLSGYVVATLLVRPFSGFIVDTFDRRRVLTLCFFVFFICFAGYIGAGTLLMFAIVRTLHGLPFGAATVANSTVAIDVLPSSRRNEGIGYYGLSNNLAMAIGPSAGIWIYSATSDFHLLFWISLVLAFAGYYCTTKVRLPERQKVEGKPHLSLDHFFLGKAWLMAVNILLFGLCWGVMANYVALFGKERLGITDGTGLFFLLLSTGLVISRLFGTRQLRKGRIVPSCAMGVICSTAGSSRSRRGNGVSMWQRFLSVSATAGCIRLSLPCLSMWPGTTREARPTPPSSYHGTWVWVSVSCSVVCWWSLRDMMRPSGPQRPFRLRERSFFFQPLGFSISRPNLIWISNRIYEDL